MTEKLWDLYERVVSEEYHLEQKLKGNKDCFLTAIDRSVKNGVANGILQSIETLEDNKLKTWKRAFDVFCKVRGKDINTKFGFWMPLTEAQPLKDDIYLVTLDGGICGMDEPIISMCGYENGKWDEDVCVIAWMPLPTTYKVG